MCMYLYMCIHQYMRFTYVDTFEGSVKTEKSENLNLK